MHLRHVLRRLGHAPAFTVVTALTLAIGIGANTAIFSVVEGVLLKPLAYPEPEKLIAVDHSAPGISLERAGAAPFLYFTYREQSRTFQDVGMWRPDSMSVTGLAEPEQVDGVDVTDGILPILGAQPVLGRVFSRTDDSPDSPETVMLSYGYWQRKFGGDRSVLGRRIMIDGVAREIIGVLPAKFRFLDVRADLLLPMRLNRGKTFLGNFSYSALARLKPGVTLAQANADAARLIPVAMASFPVYPGFSLKMFHDARLQPELRSLKQDMIGDIGKVLWVLMGTIGIVLLIACANVANLLLVRTEARQHELAIRTALGAGWDRIARELFAESLALSVLGGLLGLALAYGGLRLLVALAPANLPRLQEIGIDATVLLFALAVSLAAGALFGAIPVFKYARGRVADALRAGGRTLSQSKERQRVRNTLVVVQVALALVLLIGSGLMIRTFQTLRNVQPGFTHPDEVQTFRVYIPPSQVKDPAQVVRMQQAIMDKAAALPGVSSAALTNAVPMSGNNWTDPIFTEDHVYAETKIPPLRRFRFVSPGLLKTLGRPLVAGRDFTWTDLYDKRPVAMVSDNLACELWGSPAAALGKRIRENLKAPWREIVGVAADGRDDGVNQKPPTIAYWPLLMDHFEDEAVFAQRSISIVVRSSRTGSSGFVNDLSRAVWSVNPNLPLAGVRTLREIYSRSMARTSFTLVMLAIAGAMALLLGVIGIYGAISYGVAHRTREIGVRIALGAQSRQVQRMFLQQGLLLTVTGVGIGLLGAVAVTRWMSSLL
ncbi:MAG TPA: ABC transporter permease, partial [Bryobacteraceae bacterium]